MPNRIATHDGFASFEADESSGKELYTYAEEVIETWKRIGVGDRPRPIITEDHNGLFHDLEPGEYFDGRLPTVIKKLSLDQISALHNLFSNWAAYLAQQTQKIGAHRSEARRQERLMWSMIREKHKDTARQDGVKMSDQQASDSTRTDLRYIEPDARYEELNVTYSFLMAMVEVTEQDMSTISREITLRGLEVEAAARGRGFGNRSNSSEPTPTSLRGQIKKPDVTHSKKAPTKALGPKISLRNRG